MQIIIDKATTLDDLDNYYGQLQRAGEVNAKVDLLLPKTLENNFIGLVPYTLQFIITWIRYEFSGNLLLDIEEPEKEDFDEILENELLFPAYTLAWNKSKFLNKTGTQDLRAFLRNPLREIRNSMVRVKSLKGRKLSLVSIDHFPYPNGGLPAFETPDEFIDNEANTTRNLRNGLEDVLSYSNDAKREFGEYGQDFIAIIHELFKNTYEWARTDFNNVIIDPNIRGLLVKFYKKKRTTFLGEYRMHKGLRSYFENHLHRENSKEELYFVEISVFDSGVGFVNKFESADKNKLTDIEIIKRCLMLHMTSAQGLNKDDKGVGLDRILKTIDKKGFIRIKTNKRSIYRNMISHPYKAVEKENDLDLFDWKTENNNNFSEFPEASGTALSILYPLATNPIQ